MPSTYSTSLGIELIQNGEQAGSWGQTTNTNLGTLLEQAISGVGNYVMIDSAVLADNTLAIGNGTANVSRNAVLVLTGTLTATRTLTVPNGNNGQAFNKFYAIRNGTSGNQSVLIKTSAGTGVTLANGYTQLMYCDGTNVVAASVPFNSTTGQIQYSSLAGVIPVANGGTNLSTIPTNGQLLIGNGTGYTLATIASSPSITVTNGPGTITLSAAAVAVPGSQGNIIFNGGGTPAAFSANANLFWDNGNGRLGLGTSSPQTTLHVSGTSYLNGNVGVKTNSPSVDFQVAGTSLATTAAFGDANFSAYVASTNAYISFSSGNYMEYQRSSNRLIQYINNTPVFLVNSSGDLQMNSGYGSIATAYGCRAWVNFNGSGAATVRASANITSVFYHGTGDYTVNFANAMPDANYMVALSTNENGAAPVFLALKNGVAPTTTSVRLGARYGTSWSPQDVSYGMVSIFR